MAGAFEPECGAVTAAPVMAGRSRPPASLILLVRHGHAGSKAKWSGDDRLRPLSRRGRAQARGLAQWAGPWTPTAIISSPLLRCQRTVQPLSNQLGAPVQLCEDLGPNCPTKAVQLLESLKPNSRPVIVCTHGEVIEHIQRHLPGAKAAGFGADQPRDKGSAWVLQLQSGVIDSAHYVPPTRAR